MPDPPAAYIGLTPVPEKDITNPSDWDTVGWVVGSASTMAYNVSMVRGRATFELNAVGTGARMRIVEIDSVGEVVLVDHAFPNTGGTWVQYKVDTTEALREGFQTYRVDVTLGGATSAKTRGLNLFLVPNTDG